MSLINFLDNYKKQPSSSAEKLEETKTIQDIPSINSQLDIYKLYQENILKVDRIPSEVLLSIRNDETIDYKKLLIKLSSVVDALKGDSNQTYKKSICNAIKERGEVSNVL